MLSPQGAVSVLRRPLLKSEKWRTRHSKSEDIMEGNEWKPKELAEAASREPSEFADVLKTALVSNFNSVFRYLKTQKLVLRKRSLTWIVDLEKRIEMWLPHAPLKGKQKAQLRRHLEVSRTMQELLDIVDRQSSDLRIWKAPTEDLLRGLFSWIQDHETKCEQLKPAAELTDSIAALRFMEYQRKALRYACDYVVCIVNQISWVGVRDTGDVRLEAADIKKAVSVASIADLLLHILDCYTYKNFRVSVKGKHVELHALKSEIEDAGTWSTLRDGSRKFAETAGSPLRLEDVRSIASKFSVESDSFADFLNSPEGSEVFAGLDQYCGHHARMMRSDVEELIDLNFELRTRAGQFRVHQLLECWSFLLRLALCAHVWRSVYKKTTLPVAPESCLLKWMIRTLGLEKDVAEALLAQFSLIPGERNQDPFFRPLIKLNSKDRLIAGPFIETGRFARNLFTIAIREGGVDFAAKGLKPLRSLGNEFTEAGYSTLINVPVRVPEGTLTDADIVATRDGYLFVGQTKVLINPDTPYDDWKIHENLGKAAVQLEHSLEHISQLAERLRLEPGGYVVVPFLLTNVWDFTGATVAGFKVIDFSYLSLLLRGGELWVLNPGPTPTRQVVKLIAGKYPTGEELCRLLRRSLHEQMFQKPKIDRHSFFVGDWTVTVPVDLGKQPELKPGSHSVEIEG
jgi:hypothetical protein